MKKILFLLVFLVNLANAFAQTCFEVKYDFVETKLKTGYTTVRPTTLYYENGKSLFLHSKGKKNGQVNRKPDSTEVKPNLNADVIVVGGWYEDTIGVAFAKDFIGKTIDFREFFYGNPYISSEKMPQIKWQLSAEKKRIGQFLCQKANTTFRGRAYEVWYAPEIPISDGPWKLQGLPGLILEAIDKTGEFKFLYKGINLPCKEKRATTFKKVGKIVDLATYRKADTIEGDAYMRKWQSYDWGRDAKVTISRHTNIFLETEYER